MAGECISWILCLHICLVVGAQLPIIPGSISTLADTSEQVYEPHALTRSLYSADGDNAFLLVDSSALVIMSAPVGEISNYSITQLAGHPVITGYVDGAAREARFEHISDFVQTRNGERVYISDQDNHCIRIFDRVNNNVTVFAGDCTHYGQRTGPSLLAQFSAPSGIVLSNNEEVLYLADRRNNRILRIDLLSEEKWVQKVIDNTSPAQSRVILPTDMTMSSDGDKLYVTTENGLVRITNFNDSNAIPRRHRYGGFHPESHLLDFTLIEEERYAVATDVTGHRLLFMDLIGGGTAQFCTGYLTEPFAQTDGSSDTCEINSPQGIAVQVDGSLLITEHTSKVIRRVTFQLPPIGLTTTEPPSTTPFTIPTTSRRTPRIRTMWKSTTPTTTFWFDDDFITTSVPHPHEEESPLILGLSAGILIPLVLVGVLVSLVSYIRLQSRRQAEMIYVRRTQQGGYDGPEGNNQAFHTALQRNSYRCPQDQPPGYTPAPVHPPQSSEEYRV